MSKAFQKWLTSYHRGLTENSLPALRRFERSKAQGLLVAILPTLTVAAAKAIFGDIPNNVWDLLFAVAFAWFGVTLGLMFYITAISVIKLLRRPKRDGR
ncbi:hypothetical protein [Brevundimonas naejangsanensis]|uniref:hypothetical protein n=1 Tax=Brevundimonas naejangsanensis TaxID=588932 RepID=UPI003D04003D